ncbi:RNA pseudouridine synthase [Shewanella sp. NIFS-20-20]|uniref:RNA pseudouridine synthase n=1 Tax=Shewanella sp. NIFS-20-20 TaxID=2853806 RepID=UPI001C48F1F5|nr:RNA pseudouridine synthase [Shewanella sp. NIFS-20-20]MBV7314118.1 pseudouridine synthase [Shewanella sp. NIFS-20-20]
MRINQYLAYCGVASRRQASRLIEAGRVSINGQLAKHIDTLKLSHRHPPKSEQQVQLDGITVTPPTHYNYWIYHKPVGVDCRLLADDPSSIYHRLQLPTRAYPVGRLDKDSRGLVLITNDGLLTQHLLHPEFAHHKSYLVTVSAPLNADFIQQMANGVSYQAVTTQPCQCQQVNQRQFRIQLTQGMNRQIRRMCQALGFKVIDLKRESMMTLSLNGLAENTLRPLEAAEISELYQACSLKIT